MNGFSVTVAMKGSFMTNQILASCKCGHAQLKTQSQPILQLVCHCADCREATGDDFSIIVFFKLNAVQLLGDLMPHGFISDLGNQTERLACGQCQQMMFDKSAGFPRMFGVMAQRIAPPFVAEAKIHVWVQSKLDQVILPEGAKIFEQGMA